MVYRTIYCVTHQMQKHLEALYHNNGIVTIKKDVHADYKVKIRSILHMQIYFTVDLAE